MDLKKFPKSEGGFYSFGSPEKLVSAIGEPLYKTEHGLALNCFDAVITLTDGQMKSEAKPDDIIGPILFSKADTNRLISTFAATASDLFTEIYPDYYRALSDALLPTNWQTSRVCVTAALFRNYILPAATSEETLPEKMLSVLKATWQKQGMIFPKKFEVVLCHQVSFSSKFFCTTHAGVIFPRGKHFTYIEKSGISGPFNRLDFEDKKDLLPWLAIAYKDSPDHHSHVFATFNNKQIEKLELTK